MRARYVTAELVLSACRYSLCVKLISFLFPCTAHISLQTTSVACGCVAEVAGSFQDTMRLTVVTAVVAMCSVSSVVSTFSGGRRLAILMSIFNGIFASGEKLSGTCY
jgi:hypothetical protein